MIARDRQHRADRALQPLLEDARQPLALHRVLGLGLVDGDVARQPPLAPQVVPGILESLEQIAGIELQALGEGGGETMRCFGRGAGGLGLVGGERRIAPDRLAVLAPVAAQRPARQLLAGVPFALAEMQQWRLGEAVGQTAEQHARQPSLLRPQRQRVPFRSVHVVDRHEGRLAAHGQPHVALGQGGLDRGADLQQARPLFLGVGLGGARRLAHARHRHLEGELDLGLVDGALDRRGARRLGRAGERDVALARQQARGRIEPDPARARQVDLAPGMEVGEILGRPLRPVERLLVGHELDQVARGEARGEAQVAQDGDQQPAAVATRALGAGKRLLEALHAGLQPDDIADLLLQAGVQADDEIDGALRGAWHLRQPGREQRPRRRDLAERRDLLGQRRVVGEGPGLGRGLEEEVERIVHRHVGDQVDRDLELRGLLREHQPGEMVALRILLPVDEMGLRLDLQRIGQDRGAAVRGGPQAHDLRPQRHRPVVGVGRPMMQRDVNAHGAMLVGTCGFARRLHLASHMPATPQVMCRLGL